MLKTVVQNQHVAPEALFEQAPGPIAVGAYAERGDAGAEKHLWLIAGLLCSGVSPRFQNQLVVNGMPAIAACQDARMTACAVHLLYQIKDARRLARAPQRNIADTDDRGI